MSFQTTFLSTIICISLLSTQLSAETEPDFDCNELQGLGYESFRSSYQMAMQRGLQAIGKNDFETAHRCYSKAVKYSKASLFYQRHELTEAVEFAIETATKEGMTELVEHYLQVGLRAQAGTEFRTPDLFLRYLQKLAEHYYLTKNPKAHFLYEILNRAPDCPHFKGWVFGRDEWDLRVRETAGWASESVADGLGEPRECMEATSILEVISTEKHR